MKNSPSSQALMSRVPEATKATPAERPSMLSRRLKAFVTPTSQRTVTTVFIQSKGRNEVRTSAATITRAASTWPAAFGPPGSACRARRRPGRPRRRARLRPAARAASPPRGRPPAAARGRDRSSPAPSGMPGERGNGQVAGEHDRVEREEDGQAAHARRRRRVHLARSGLVDHTQPQRPGVATAARAPPTARARRP